jgi:hypothetical protein
MPTDACVQPSFLDEIPGPNDAEFNGATYDRELDRKCLSKQMLIVYDLMQDKRFWTLRELAQATGYSQTSVSARLRDFRKEKFGSYLVESRRRGDPSDGIHEYRLGEKGAGKPNVRGFQPTPAHEAALRVSDEMIRFMRHQDTCNVYKTHLPSNACTCGMQRARALYLEARQATRVKVGLSVDGFTTKNP